MALSMEVGLGPGHFVLDGDPAPLPKKGAEPPRFSAYFYCGQTAGCIKMPLGMEVGLSPGDFVLDEDPAPPPKKFGPHLLWPNGCMDQDALVTEVGLGLCNIVLDGDPAPLPQFSANVHCGWIRLDGLRCHLASQVGGVV